MELNFLSLNSALPSQPNVEDCIKRSGSGMLSDRCGTPEARGGYLAIAPSLLFVCVMSAFRGYMQGHRIMLPTAISQLIEQVGKVFVALPLAYFGMRISVAYAAAGVLLGTSIAEGAALLYMAVKHLLSRRAFAQVAQDESAAVLSRKRIAIRLATISIPITLGACIVPLAGWIDSFMLTNLMEGGGMDTTEALVRYGLYSGMVLTLINVPTALAMAMSTNLVPAISAGMARGDKDYVSRESITGLRIAAVIGFPCAVGMSILAKPILFLFYSGSYTAEHLTIAGKLLQMSAMTIGLFTMVQATSGILQGCGKQRIPMYTLLAGVACKVLLNFLLVRIPALNIHGAPIASLVCYTVSMAPNLYYVVKYAARRFPVTDIVLRPLAATLAMGAVVWLLWQKLFTESYLSAGRGKLMIAVIVCVAAGIAVYVVCAVLFKAVRSEDLPARLRRCAKR